MQMLDSFDCIPSFLSTIKGWTLLSPYVVITVCFINIKTDVISNVPRGYKGTYSILEEGNSCYND